MKCPIEHCPFQATGFGLCHGHFTMAPKPVQSEIRQLIRRHKGCPAHQSAIKRACTYVNQTLQKWAAERVTVPAEKPVSLPYKDN